MYPTIQNKLNTLVTQYFDKKPHEMATFGFNAKGLNSEFQTKLVEMTNVWSVSIFPPNCRVEHGDSLEVNKSTFQVKLRDFQNLAPFKERGLNETNIDVVVKDPIGLFIIFFLYLMDSKDVTYNLNRKQIIIITIVRCKLLSEISKPQN